MKNYLLLLLLAILLPDCGSKNTAFNGTEGLFSTPEKVVVTGKALNLEAGTTDLEVILFRLGLNSETMLVPIDPAGNFRLELETYAPLTVSIRTPNMLSLLVFPGDTLHAEFDGNTRDLKKFHASLNFSGDRAKTNLDMQAFDQLFLPDPQLMNFGKIFGAIKNYTPDQFLLYLDTLQTAGNAVYDRFVETCSPNEEAKAWARTCIDLRYADFLGQYIAYFDENIHHNDVKIPRSFSENMLAPLPLTEAMLVTGTSLGTYTNRFHFQYLDWRAPIREQVRDTPDPLLKQLVLMEYIRHRFEDAPDGIKCYEDHVAFIDEVITLPYLRKPLHELYLQTKMRVENPTLHAKAMLQQLENSSAGEIMHSILEENRGKVIYIDVWATWCGPCKAEMPYSRKLMQDMEGRDVVFVYLCVDSNKSTWKADLDKLQLAGLQYFLTKEQSTGFRQAFEIRGVPEYLLFDRSGSLAARGLRPSGTEIRTKIDELLQ